MQITTNKNIFF